VPSRLKAGSAWGRCTSHQEEGGAQDRYQAGEEVAGLAAAVQQAQTVGAGSVETKHMSSVLDTGESEPVVCWTGQTALVSS
jgi:hypothetical protein